MKFLNLKNTDSDISLALQDPEIFSEVSKAPDVLSQKSRAPDLFSDKSGVSKLKSARSII